MPSRQGVHRPHDSSARNSIFRYISIDDIPGLIEHRDGSGTQDALVGERSIDHLRGDDSSAGAADLYHFDIPGGGQIDDQLRKPASKLEFVHSGRCHISADRKHLGPLAALCSHFAEPRAAVQNDLGNIHQGFDIVDNRGLSPKSFWPAGMEAYSAPLPSALDGIHETRFLAAHIGAGSFTKLDVHDV